MEAQQGSVLDEKLLAYLGVLRRLLQRVGVELVEMTLARSSARVPAPGPDDRLGAPHGLPHGGMPLKNILAVFASRVAELGFAVRQLTVRHAPGPPPAKGAAWKFALAIVDDPPPPPSAPPPPPPPSQDAAAQGPQAQQRPFTENG